MKKKFSFLHMQALCFLLLSLIYFGCAPSDKEEAPTPEISETLLLSNYRPESVYNIPETKIEKAHFPVIDMHTHIYANNTAELKAWLATMDAAGIEKSIVLTMAYGAAFDSLVEIYSAYLDRFELWCGFDYSTYKDPDFPEKAIAELRRCVEKGAKGVGELGDKGKGLFYCKPAAFGMHPDDARMDRLWAVCAELGLPVNLHIADPIWMYEKMDSTNDGMMNALKWRLDNQKGIKSHSEMIGILENTLRRNPETTFIACHYANCTYDFSIIGNLLDKYSNLHVDLSARYAETGAIPRNTKKFISKYQDRVFYGTDMGRSPEMYQMTFRILESDDEHIYHPYNSYHWPIHALDLPEGILEKIYRSNALSL